ncbi:MAG: DegV family protein, partial [Desulfobacteraceae bacterium]|nr:DegV family protein [Desulfobacteraceae bacterium]
GISLVPIHILINDESRLHGVDIVNQEVVEHLIQKDDVSTEPPTPREYYKAFKKANEEYDLIYSLHVSSGLSECYNNAKHGLRILRKKQNQEAKGLRPDNNIKIIDTKCASISQAQVVNRFANIIKTEQDQAKIDKYIAWLIKKAMMFFVVDDLYWLKKAGQLNTVSGFFGKLLDIKPVVKLEDGKLIPADKPKGKDAALDSMLRTIAKTTPKYRRGVEIWVGHSAALLDAKYVREQLSSSFKIEEKKIPIVEAGPTIAAHTGPGVVCASIIPK